MPYQPKMLIADDNRSIRLMLETGLMRNAFGDSCTRSCRVGSFISDWYYRLSNLSMELPRLGNWRMP